MKSLKIKEAIALYKELKAKYEALKTPKFKKAEKEFEEVKDFIASYAKEQGAFSLNGVNVEVAPVNGWDVDKLEAFALRHPDLDKCRKVTKRATIQLIN